MAFSENHSIDSGREEDVRAYKLARLIAMLQPEQVEKVPTRADLAPGRFEHVRAVQALESALLDNFPRVRSQAVNTFGRIASEQASEALINLLRDDDTDEADRLAATRALSSQDTAAARKLLQ